MPKLLQLRALESLAPTVVVPLLGDQAVPPGEIVFPDPDEVNPPVDGDEVHEPLG